MLMSVAASSPSWATRSGTPDVPHSSPYPSSPPPSLPAGEGVDLDEGQVRLICPTCRADQCLSCGVEWHKDSTCAAYQEVGGEKAVHAAALQPGGWGTGLGSAQAAACHPPLRPAATEVYPCLHPHFASSAAVVKAERVCRCGVPEAARLHGLQGLSKVWQRMPEDIRLQPRCLCQGACCVCLCVGGGQRLLFFNITSQEMLSWRGRGGYQQYLGWFEVALGIRSFGYSQFTPCIGPFPSLHTTHTLCSARPLFATGAAS